MPKRKAVEPAAPPSPAPSQRKTVAFLGHEGSFTEQAAHEFFARKNATFVPRKTFEDVFNAVTNGECDHGVVPMENSETGSFRRVYDQLVKHKLFIVGECAVKEDFCLVALKGVKKKDITQVYSHPIALESCKAYLETMEAENKQEVQCVVNGDTAQSCQLIKEKNLRNAAAIASKRAAQLHGEHVLEHQIADDSSIATRYIVLGRAPANVPPHGKLRASLALSLNNEPGSMFRLLSCFRFRDVNILKLETRPSASVANSGMNMFKVYRHWEYVFYIDYEPTQSKETNDALVANLKEYCLSVREFGTYNQNLPALEWHGQAWSKDVKDTVWM